MAAKGCFKQELERYRGAQPESAPEGIVQKRPGGSWGREKWVDAPTSYDSRWRFNVRAEFRSDMVQVIDLTGNSWLQPYLVRVKPSLDM